MTYGVEETISAPMPTERIRRSLSDASRSPAATDGRVTGRDAARSSAPRPADDGVEPETSPPLALVVDDDQGFVESLALLVQAEGFAVETASSLAEARAVARGRVFDVALVDLLLPDGNGMDLRGDGISEVVPLVVITGNASVDSAVCALRTGVTDYLSKPVDPTELRSLLQTVLRTRSLVTRVHRLRHELRRAGRFGRLVGRSAAMQRVYDMIQRVAPTNASVLITGESGVGKEVVAETIHEMSARSDANFLAVNCGAITDTLIESELFGHERGSFTGAQVRHQGVFESTNGGTLLLDEIAEMPMEMQVRLLRVLENGEIRRVGSSRSVTVDVRVLAATNREPERAIAEGRLREDLYFRLAVFPIHVPALRDRGDDVILLADHFLSKFNETNHSDKTWSGAALDAIRRRTWSGNVRELRNAVYRAAIMAEHEILPGHLDAHGSSLPSSSQLAAEDGVVRVPVGTAIADAERLLVEATLDRCDGNKRRTARALGISVRTLYNRLHDYGLMA